MDLLDVNTESHLKAHYEHFGELNDLIADALGNVNQTLQSAGSLYPPFSFVGRSVVVESAENHKTACGVVGWQ